jgi:hypothetical protein
VYYAKRKNSDQCYAIKALQKLKILKDKNGMVISKFKPFFIEIGQFVQ